MGIILCNDLLEMIGKEYLVIQDIKKNKQKYNNVLLHLEQYIEECLDHDNLNKEDYKDYYFMCNGNIRVDCRFLEYNNLWNSKCSEIIINKYGEETINYFMDNWF